MASLREEQLRSNRRLTRQLVGIAALILALIGLFTVIGWCINGLRTMLDDSGRKQDYADRLYGLVIFDTMPFEDVSAVDPSTFKQAAIWGSVYLTQKNGGSLDEYDRDPDTGAILLPKLELDTYITNLLGPDYEIPEGAFDTDMFNYQYNAEKECYLVPITGSVAQYTPQVEKISTQSGLTYVTVGYIPTMINSSNGDLSLTAPTEPTKYMDFVFARGANRQWFLKALQESEMKPADTPTPAPTAAAGAEDTQSIVQQNLESTMTDAAGTDPDASSEEQVPDAYGEDWVPDGLGEVEEGGEQPAEEPAGEGGEEQPADGEETPPAE